MGDGLIFLKSHRYASFNKDLSNEPNFNQIHFAGQYLQCFFVQEFDNIGEEIAVDRITVWLDPLDATQEYTEGNKTNT
jgi:hypothetical protein